MKGGLGSMAEAGALSPELVEAAQQWGLWLQPRVIALDGPAGSGKSTIGYDVARFLGFLFFDTGAMYRAVTWAALDRGLTPSDGGAVGALAEAIVMDILPPRDLLLHGRNSVVLVDGREVTAELRRPEVDQSVSIVSSQARVRAALSAHQRRVGARYGRGDAELPGVVMVGRDIGTVIMPDARLKVFLDASAEERARRRHRELLAKGQDVAYIQVLADIRKRDEFDSRRALSPLRAADDAVVIDTSALGINSVVARVLHLVVLVGQGDRIEDGVGDGVGDGANDRE
jgi:cytidylate kinase